MVPGAVKNFSSWFNNIPILCNEAVEATADIDNGSLVDVVLTNDFTKRKQVDPSVVRAALKHQVNLNDRLSLLKTMNALLTGAEKTQWRAKPVWIGRVSPDKSWWVGSPPNALPQLMRHWNLIASHQLPPLLCLAVEVIRFLQIHPFADGNGRTIRCYALAVARYWGLDQQMVGKIISYLWRDRGGLLHATSYAIKERNDWSGYLKLWLDAIK